MVVCNCYIDCQRITKVTVVQMDGPFRSSLSIAVGVSALSQRVDSQHSADGRGAATSPRVPHGGGGGDSWVLKLHEKAVSGLGGIECSAKNLGPVRHPGLKLNIPAWLFCMSRCADFEFRGT